MIVSYPIVVPDIIDKWMASCKDIPSNTIKIDTPNASVKTPKLNTPIPTWLCHEEARDNTGPQKNPNPKSGRTRRKMCPIEFGEISPGHTSP